jgi:hypothetical protein
MTDLERALLDLRDDVVWPPTPELELRVPQPARRGDLRRPAFAALALAVVALAVALAVPSARSAILHLFRVGGASIERVQTLPAAQQRPLAASLGRPVSRTAAGAAFDSHVALPAGVQLYESGPWVVSALLASDDGPVLASEFSSVPAGIVVKKVATSGTRIRSVSVRPGTRGFWLSGRAHVVLEPTPARLAGNTLLWDDGRFTFRLEGRRLRLVTALALAHRFGR